ncbi:MAG: hypothetical protein NTX17_00235 [Candidatus Eisenbacteria bacterium]|nr:hypothetical protein [Candidatus Eisenbacteria bacterium]
MKSQTKVVLFCGLAALATLASSLCVAGPIFEERGTLTVGAQVQQCLLVGDAPPTDDFDSGTGFAMRLRYYLGNNRAFGISFESQVFDAVPAPVSDDQPRGFKDAIVMADYLFYFDRESSLSRYVVVGLGLHHPGRDYRSGSEVGPDGLAASLGGGLEYFFHRSTSVDVSVRGYGLFGQGDGLLGSVEAAVGMNFYIMN